MYPSSFQIQESVLISPLEDEDKEENVEQEQDNNSHSTTSTLNIDQGKQQLPLHNLDQKVKELYLTRSLYAGVLKTDEGLQRIVDEASVGRQVIKIQLYKVRYFKI